MDPEAAQLEARRATVGRTLLSALHRAVTVADGSIASIATAAERREGVRTARRELKAVRAIAPLCRTGANDSTIDGVLEFAAKANQLLGPLRDRDALTRSIHRLSERFAEGESRRVVRTVLLATLIFGESDRRDDAAFAGAALERARRSLRQTRAFGTRGDGRGRRSASPRRVPPCIRGASARGVRPRAPRRNLRSRRGRSQRRGSA